MTVSLTSKPTVFIASPYTRGDPAINTHFQCAIFDRLLSDGIVLPVAPLWSHFQHTIFPRAYEEWIAYDQAMLPLYDCCLRLAARHQRTAYVEEVSRGADAEAESFRRLGRPVFCSIEELYAWAQRKAPI